MEALIPSVVELQALLDDMTHAEMQALARVSEVPFTTLWKIKDGTTGNPGVETVRKFFHHIGEVKGRRSLQTPEDAAPTPATEQQGA